ncbi:MAG: UTP--glucose-1-phosphate uridylyltransferase, partial [Planctomycetota bacterium]|nr:UTP--glucose-1-phosphate uridylyltransferase [Planctomycetota bacterium]
DYLGLLKAAVIASGTVPPGIEGSGEDLADLLATMAGPGRGLEIVSHVHGIPKGSRLAVSTNLLASLITVCMRATGQTTSMEGVLSEDERRLAAARAILGEWLGGSGGGWQDSGGLWPGMKLITGQRAEVGDPEYGISRGRLLPGHRVLGDDDANPEVRRELRDSLVLVHGGMAQNVGPVLEMVTEKYLLRSQQEWDSRQEALGVLTSILAALKNGDVAAIGAATSHNFEGPIQGIIPWASNEFTERVIRTVRERHGAAYLGFCMLGGMTGGGMGFLFKPDARPAAQEDLLEIMTTTKRDLESGLPFAMDPVVYDFEINERGTECSMLRGDARLPSMRHIELDRPGSTERTTSLSQLLEDGGFDRISHEEIRADLREGRIGLAQNRLPAHTDIRDAEPSQVIDALGNLRDAERKVGEAALAAGEVAVVTLAAGTGSRWTQGAGVVKALNPFCRLAGAHRTFLEVHLAKSRRTGLDHGQRPLHVFTTSLFTHDPIAQHLVNRDYYGYREHLRLSLGRAVGLRLVPMERDLRFAWEETPQQLLDTQAQKVQDSLRSALIGWARDGGEGSDYTDNLPLQCIHPVGHWFEIPNLLRNGVLTAMLEQRPQLRYLLLHNIDTLGADLDPGLLGTHIERGSCLSFEVTPRHMEDRGGGLASVDGRPRLIEGLAMPHKEDEFGLSYYNSLTTWIDLDALLSYMGLTRGDLGDTASVDDAVRKAAARMPTYIALKDVKKRWGHGQEDVFPVTQFEKLWGDMSAIADIDTSFFVVPRSRGQQLKDPHQLDGWLRDGSAAHVETLCQW